MDLIQALGAYGTVTIEQIGSYAGFAAVLGLAVLSALYFSQARDVRRLRDWAGRAPERDAEARSRVAAATVAGQQNQVGAAAQPAAAAGAQPAAAQPAAAAQPVPAAAQATPAAAGLAAAAAVAKPAGATAAAMANSGGNSSGATATPAKAPALTAATAGAAAAASGGSAGPVHPRTGPPVPGLAKTSAAKVGAGRPSSQTSILKPQDRPRERWYRRIAPRYIALIVAGVLVVGGGIAVGVIQLLSEDDAPTTGTRASGTGGGGGGGEDQAEERPERAPIRPGDVSVAVLNATAVPGLAKQFANDAQTAGFKRDTVGNAANGEQKAESVVMYAAGKKREARLVSRKFDVSAIEPVDEASRGLAPQADVILVIGANKTP